MNVIVILVLTAIGIACGAIIYLAYVKIPHKVKGLDKIEEISNALPGMNCGACGYAGCFAYAQELAKNPGLITQTPCAVAMQNPESVSCLEKALNISLDASALCKKALIHCGGTRRLYITTTAFNPARRLPVCGAATRSALMPVSAWATASPPALRAVFP